MKTKYIIHISALVFLVPISWLYFYVHSTAGSFNHTLVFGGIGLTSLWLLTYRYKKYATHGISSVLAVGLTIGVILAIYLLAIYLRNTGGDITISDPLLLASIIPMLYLFIILASIFRIRKQTICETKGIDPVKPASGSKLEIAIETIGQTPINGLRQKEENGTNGWYIWCGETMSENDDFFSPLLVEHISEHLPEVKKYLELPPGYRFLIDGNNYEDNVWYDEKLLNA